MAKAEQIETPKKSTGTFDFAVVVADKEPNSRTIQALPRRLLPTVEGELKALTVENTTSVESPTTGETSAVVTTKNYITAEYFDLFSNRVFPPDVRKGEQVLLFNFHDTDTHYWLSTGRDDNLRRTERFRLAVSDDVAFTKELTEDNTWYFEMDSRDKKHILISTSKSDKEKYRYLIKVDALNSKIQVMDDGNNEFTLESDTPRWYLRNRDGAVIDLIKKDIIIAAPRDIVLRADRQIVKASPTETTSQEQGDQTNVIRCKNLAITCTDSFVVDAPSVGLNGSTVVGGTLMSGHHQAEGYSTGGGASRSRSISVSSDRAYTSPSTDTNTGAGSGGNAPIVAGPNSANRHCAAWEQVTAAIEEICENLVAIDGITGYGETTSSIRAKIQKAIMLKNTGE